MRNGSLSVSGARVIATRASVFRIVCVWLVAMSFCTKAANVSDDFSAGVGSWVSSPGWILVEQAGGQYVYRGDSTGDTFAQNGLLNLGSSWRLEVDVRFRRYYADNKARGLLRLPSFRRWAPACSSRQT